MCTTPNVYSIPTVTYPSYDVFCRFALGVPTVRKSAGLLGTAHADNEVTDNHFVGSGQDPCSINNLTTSIHITSKIDEHPKLAYHVKKLVTELFASAERTSTSVSVSFFTSIALDHKLYARAALNFRGVSRYDAVSYGNYEGEYQHDLGKLVALLRLSSVTGKVVDRDFAVIEPFFDVSDLPNSSKYSGHKQRLQTLSDGSRRLGRRYLTLRLEAEHAYRLIPIAQIVRPSHLVTDPMRTDCFYEQDSSVYYA